MNVQTAALSRGQSCWKDFALIGSFVTHDERLAECQQIIGYRFQNPELLMSALTHASSADSRLVSNERLEFLGDAVLGVVICEKIYQLYPDLLEGEMTKIKSVVVSRRTCTRLTKQMGLERFLVIGKGMAQQETIPASVMADVFESVVAAIYLDGGLEPAKAFLHMHMTPEIETAAAGHHGGNYKSVLQQMAQREFGATPTYEVVGEKGPDHSKSFKVSALLGTLRYPPAWGRNKKEAEQRAALNALSVIQDREPPFVSE